MTDKELDKELEALASMAIEMASDDGISAGNGRFSDGIHLAWQVNKVDGEFIDRNFLPGGMIMSTSAPTASNSTFEKHVVSLEDKIKQASSGELLWAYKDRVKELTGGREKVFFSGASDDLLHCSVSDQVELAGGWMDECSFGRYQGWIVDLPSGESFAVAALYSGLWSFSVVPFMDEDDELVAFPTVKSVVHKSNECSYSTCLEVFVPKGTKVMMWERDTIGLPDKIDGEF